ncbi:MAG: amidohydrolase family protein [Deltaproteobacteria bacterium]
MKIDIFSHIFPKSFFSKMVEIMPNAVDMFKRVQNIPCYVNVDERFRIMDMFPEYVQILTMGMPTEAFGPPPISTNMARLANDGMAELVQEYPDRFLGFVACLPLNDPEGMMAEANRAIKDLGAVGVLIFTNVLGRPLTQPEIMPLFQQMREVDLPIWMHPTRGADFADYKGEPKSHYEIWWAFGWPYETSVTMAHLVFSGLFDQIPNIKIITHHMGGMIPYFEGRVGPGWDQLGSRTSDEDYTLLLKKLKKRPLDYFRLFYADTALFGAREATVCGLKFFGSDRTLFGTDMPLDPEKGPGYVRSTIKVIDSLDITPAERQAIYEGNARRLLKLK